MGAGRNRYQTNSRVFQPTSASNLTAVDNTDLTSFVDGFVVDTSGVYKVQLVDDSAPITIYCVAGLVYWLPIRQFWVTGSASVTNIVGLRL